ncbi:MAG: hypothetical protein SFZ03_07940 [Candidatus Melainabacteria bacterium]|nr:hypothetical protein [Candidatus Melainabacteria bacterium]
MTNRFHLSNRGEAASPLGSVALSQGATASRKNAPLILEMLLPPEALPLLALLVFLSPLALLTGESLLIPLIETIENLWKGDLQGLPSYFYLKLGAFALLSFLGLVQLLFRIKVIYLGVWARGLSRPHPLHVDYQPDAQLSMLALLNWNLYRWLMVFGPTLLLSTLTVGVSLAEFWWFNQTLGSSNMSLPIQFIVGLFVVLLLAMFTVFVFLNGFWTTAITVYGSVAAITEPDLPARTVYERCGRIAFFSPLVFVVYAGYAVFYGLLLVELVSLFAVYNIQDLLSFQANYGLLLACEMVTLVFYLGLSYIRLLAYHHALVRYYAKLPRQLKEQFSTPPSSRYADAAFDRNPWELNPDPPPPTGPEGRFF